MITERGMMANELAVRAKDDPAALAELVEHCRPWVRKFAKEFRTRRVPFADRVQEAFMGLLRSVETYDPFLGSFSTYSAYFIRAKLQRAHKRWTWPEMLSLSMNLREYLKVSDTIPCRSYDPVDEIHLEKTSPRRAYVLRKVFYEDMTLEEIGKILKVSRERIRQIKEQALSDLRG